jgi:predicted DNA-binding WGR domain protein
MNHVYLERHDDNDNMHRFYQMFVTPGLFDDWSLIKEWGRVGSPGTVRKEWFTTEQETELASQKISSKKIKKGYCLK